jgi:2-C-methyl-D-erythritol 2,4-cyclodiphosphate synthase
MNLRIGTGYDAHRLVEGRKLILCGVEIPHERGLLGHSDADVAVHALIDALLGAAALGDIGKLFPDTDAKWKGADSVALLRAVVALLAEKGWRTGNADITIICEQPKLAPHIQQMRANIAAALGAEIGAVSVKATTVEGMGAIGRREGIAAQAAALVVGF